MTWQRPLCVMSSCSLFTGRASGMIMLTYVNLLFLPATRLLSRHHINKQQTVMNGHPSMLMIALILVHGTVVVPLYVCYMDMRHKMRTSVGEVILHIWSFTLDILFCFWRKKTVRGQDKPSRQHWWSSTLIFLLKPRLIALVSCLWDPHCRIVPTNGRGVLLCSRQII